MTEKVRGIKPKDWRRMHSAPPDRTFKIDILKNTPTMLEVCADLKKQYSGNQFALAQIALYDPSDKISQLHRKAVQEAHDNKPSDAALASSELKRLLLKRFPELKALSDNSIQTLIDKDVF